MESLKQILREIFEKGGAILAGLGSLYLYNQQYIPNIMGPFSCAMLSVGAFGIAKYILMDNNTKVANEDYQKLLVILDQRKSEIQANTDKLEELRTACKCFMSMRENLEGWQGDPSLVRDENSIIEELLRTRNGDTSLLASKGSTQSTVSGFPAGQGSFTPSPNGTDVAMEKQELLEAMTEAEIIVQKLLQEVFQEMLEEVCESVLDEEAEKVMNDISQKMQKEVAKMMESEFTEEVYWKLTEKSEIEIIEKIQKRLFARFQKDTSEMVDSETSDEDEPQEKHELVVESLEDANLQTGKVSETKIEEVSVEKQGYIDGDVLEIPVREWYNVSEILLTQEFRNLECPKHIESDQLRSDNLEENLEKQEDKMQESFSSSKETLDEILQQISGNLQGSFIPSPKGTYVEVKKQEPMEAMTEEEIIEKLLQEVFQEMLEEVCESVLDEEAEKVMNDISQKMQKEVAKMMESEFTEEVYWKLTEKSEIEIIEKIQKRLFARLQDDTFEIIDYETCDEDEPQEVVESLEDANLQMVKASETKIEEVSVEKQRYMDGDVLVIPAREWNDVSIFPKQEFRNLEWPKPIESDRLRSDNSEKNLKKQEDKLQKRFICSKETIDEILQQIPDNLESAKEARSICNTYNTGYYNRRPRNA